MGFWFCFLKDFVYLFLETGEEREKEGRDTSKCGCLLHVPNWGPLNSLATPAMAVRRTFLDLMQGRLHNMSPGDFESMFIKAGDSETGTYRSNKRRKVSLGGSALDH